MRKYYIVIIALLVLSCCKKDDSSSSTFTKDSYPLAVGNWWQYQVNQTYEGGGYDTILLNVLSANTITPYTKYICNITLNGRVIDSGYFLQSDTSLTFVNSLPSPYFSLFPNFHLKFPVSIGQFWDGSFSGDSVLVVGVANTCSFNSHTYGPCYYTNESYNMPHNFKRETMTLAPKVGLIKQSMDFNSDTAEGGVQVNQSITLINFNVQ